MDYDDSAARPAPGIADGDPLPPDDWSGFSRAARLDAIYAAHQPELRRYLAARAPKPATPTMVLAADPPEVSTAGPMAS